MSKSRVAERSAAYALQAVIEPAFGASFDLLATAPQGVAKLRELILSLAVRGKLLVQDKRDEPASLLVERIHRQANRPAPTLSFKNVPQGWVRTTFGDVVNELCTGPFGSLISKDEYLTGGVPLVNPSHMRDGFIVEDESIAVSPRKAKELKAYELNPGDIVFARRGDVGRNAIVQDQQRGWLCGTGSFFAKLHDDLCRPFVQLVFNSQEMRRYLVGSAVGATMVNLNQRVLLLAPMSIPPLAEQARIVARVEELMQLCDALEAHGNLQDEQHARLVATLFDTLAASESAEALAENWQRIATHFDLLLDRPEAVDTLEQTLLQLAVRGLLVPQDPADEPASQLLTRIREEGERLDKAGEIRRKKSGSTGSDEQPFDLPLNWAWVSFNDIIRPDKPIAYGVLVPGPDSDGGVPFVRLSDISLTNPPARPAKSISLDVDAQFERTRLDGGEILIGVVGSIGKLGVAPMGWKGANIARAICRIVPTDLVDKEYILQLLQSEFMQTRFKGDTRTLAQPTLNVGLIRNCPTPLPPLAEQHRIVTRVEQLRRLCADLRERLQQARATQSRLADALVSAVAQSPAA